MNERTVPTTRAARVAPWRWTTPRFSLASASLIVTLPAVLLDGTVGRFNLVTTLLTLSGTPRHSMVDWRFGWVGRWIVDAPVNRRIRHSEQDEHPDRNFASIFVIWDRPFGTYYDGDSINGHVGVDDNVYNRRGLLHDLRTW